MKRLIGMVAAMALLTSSAAYAQNTVPEIHQYFTLTNAAAFNAASGTGGAVTTPADFAVNPSVTVPQNSTVYLAVWIRALRGNSTTPVTINAYNYEVTGQGNLASISTGGGDAAHRRVRDLGGSYTPTTPRTATPGTDYVDLPGADSQLFGISGAVSAAGTIDDLGTGSDSAGAYLIAVLKIDTTGVAGTVNLYMASPQNTADSHYVTGSNTGSLNTLAFGADASGGLDRKRASVLTQDMIGTLADRVSSVPDATITVIPEPGTLALLGLGLVALRRRRA